MPLFRRNPLFKPKALPVVIEDIANAIHRASANSAVAISVLDNFARVDPTNFNPRPLGTDRFLSIIDRLSSGLFCVSEEHFHSQPLIQELEAAGVRIGAPAAYWPVYRYLFSVLPMVVERRQVNHHSLSARARWSSGEYDQLIKKCFGHWANYHDREIDESVFSGYNHVRSATRVWFQKQAQLRDAIEVCRSEAEDDIVRIYPPAYGPMRQMGFQSAVGRILKSLLPSFINDVTTIYRGSFGLGFLASDSSPLPSHIDKEAGWP